MIAISIRGGALSQPRSTASFAIWTVIAVRISAFKIHFRQLRNARQVPRNETAALRLNLGSVALELRMPGTGWTPSLLLCGADQDFVDSYTVHDRRLTLRLA